MGYLGFDYPGSSLPSENTQTPPVVSENIGRRSERPFLRRAVYSNEWKLIVDDQYGGRMLFNLADDSAERRNLYTVMPDRALEMEQLYDQWKSERRGRMHAGCRQGFDGELIKSAIPF